MTNPQFLAIADALGWTLVHSLWQIVLVAILLKGLLLLSSNQSARLRYGLSLAAMLGIALGAVVTFCRNYHPIVSTMVVENVDWNTNILIDEITQLEFVQASFWKVWLAYLEQSLPYLAMAWLVGIFVFSISTVRDYFQLRELQYRHSQPVSAAWQARLVQLQQQLGIQRKVELLTCSLLEEPITFRHFKPVILLPASLLSGLSVEQVEILLLHELAHIRRYDYVVNWMQSSLEVLFFYHPAFWWISRQVRAEREHCCDDLVLQFSPQPMLYAQTLTQLQLNFHSLKTNLAMSAIKNQGVFTTRIHRLFGKYYAPNRQRKGTIVALLLVVSMMAMAFYEPANLGDKQTHEQVEQIERDSLPNYKILHSENGKLDLEYEEENLPDIHINGALSSLEHLRKIHEADVETVKVTSDGIIIYTKERAAIQEGNGELKVVKAIFEETFQEESGDDAAYHEDAILNEEGNWELTNEKAILEEAFQEELGEDVEYHEDAVLNEEGNWELTETQDEATTDGEEYKDGVMEIHTENAAYDIQIKLPKPNAAKQPLYVIDGEIYPKRKGDPVKVDPDWIKSIKVFKEQAAIDKYGNKAKHGVVEIITKSYKEYSKAHPPRAMVLNGAIYDNMDTEEESLRYIGLDKMDAEEYTKRTYLAPKEAIEKYGKVAKGGIWELHTEQSLIDIEYPKVGLAPEKAALEGNPLLVINREIVAYGDDVSAYVEAHLKPRQIKQINIWKGKDALERYGAPGKQGVLEIFTKKKHSTNRVDDETPSPQAAPIVEQLATANNPLEVYPNPAKEQVYIHFIVEKPSKVELTIFDAQGKVVEIFHGKSFNAQQFSGDATLAWQVANRPKGIYTVVLVVNGVKTNTPFVVQ